MTDKTAETFDLDGFLPYLLNQAAEATSRSFARVYRTEFEMTRTQWRVMAHLGRVGGLTATDICRRSRIEKTKMSRAVAALEARGWLQRRPEAGDRRREKLELTPAGRAVHAHLGARAQVHDAGLRELLGVEAVEELTRALRRLVAVGPASDDPA